MSSQSIAINFRVNGGDDLARYISSIQKKSQDLTNDAIKSAISQTDASKQQLSAINQTISAIERKTRIETQAARSIALEQRETALKKNSEMYSATRKGILNDRSYTNEADRKKDLGHAFVEERVSGGIIKSEYKDNLTVFKEQERQAKLQTQLSREQIDTLKETARNNVAAIIRGDKSLGEIISSASNDEEKLVASLTQQELTKEKKNAAKEGNGQGIIGGLLTIDSFNKLASNVTQLTQTTNGFSALTSVGRSSGAIVGGILGAVVGSFFGGVGALAGSAAGSSLLGEVGGDAAALKQKQGLLSQDNLKARYKYSAVSGFMSDSETDMASVGVNSTDFMGSRTEYAKRRGYAGDSDKTAKDVLNLERGYGVDQGTSAAIIEIQRSSKEGNRDLAATVTGILEKSKNSILPNGDRSFFNELLGRFTTLNKELLKTSTTVSSGVTLDIIKQFNGMGGMLNVRDQRSVGIINSIQGSLANPASDNVRALEFGVLRNQFPNAGIFDLRREMQKGLGSPKLLKGMMEYIDRMGGSDDQKKNQLSSLFPGVPLDAIETVFNGRGSLKKFDTSELKSFGLSDSTIRGKAEKNTADIDRISAENVNQTLAGNPMKAAIDAIVGALETSLGGATIQMENGKIIFNNRTPIVKNPSTQRPSIDRFHLPNGNINEAEMYKFK